MFEGSDAMESPPVYVKGDIVWVKLSSYWWPGEVKNEEDLPSDLLLDFKKPPLVIVKFFDEDSYEYLKHWSNIYPYNCEKKSEFIKKGMAGFRAKLAHMAKFPRDIGIAEEKTKGNPNILSQPEFLPRKKINYDEIFGTPSPKKSAKGKVTSSVSKKTPSKDANEPFITHRRFLGNDDYKAYICVQYTGKDRTPDSDDEEIQTLNQEPEKVLTCQSCSFKTKRLGVMLMHTKMHLEGVYITTKRKNKKVKEIIFTDSETETTTIKPPKPKQRKKKQEAPKTADVFTNLLEEWDDTDEEMAEVKTTSKPRTQPTESKAIKSVKKSGENAGSKKRDANHSLGSSQVPDHTKPDSGHKNTHDDIKNCFDFDEEEEEDDFLFPASIGRKIPRVIPEKPRSSISELLELSQKEDDLAKEKISESKGEPDEQVEVDAETDLNKKEILCVSQSFNRSSNVDDSIEHSFKELMDETELPALDDLTQTLKPEQNFHDARTIKFPDKGGTTIRGNNKPLKSGTSKKRFVTSFEDFEAGFRKIEDEERRRLAGDKEGKRNKKSSESAVLKDDNENSHEQDSDVSEEKVSLERVDTINIENSPVDMPKQSGDIETEQGPVLASELVAISKLHSSIDSIEERNTDEKLASAEVTIPQVEPKRKFRRRTKQSAEKSEEVVKDENCHTTVDDIESRSKLAIFDAELEAIKKDLESSQKGDINKEDNLKEKSDKTEMSIEQLTKELEGSTDNSDSYTVTEQKEDANKELKLEYPRTRRKTKHTELIDEILPTEINVSKQESINKIMLKQTKSLPEDPQTTEFQEVDLNIPITEVNVVDVTLEKSLPVATWSIGDLVKTRRGRSKGISEQLSVTTSETTTTCVLVDQNKDINDFKTKIHNESFISKKKAQKEKQNKQQQLVDAKDFLDSFSPKRKGKLQEPIEEYSQTKDTSSVKHVGAYSEHQNSTLSEDLHETLDKPIPRRGRSKKLEEQITGFNEVLDTADNTIESGLRPEDFNSKGGNKIGVLKGVEPTPVKSKTQIKVKHFSEGDKLPYNISVDSVDGPSDIAKVIKQTCENFAFDALVNPCGDLEDTVDGQKSKAAKSRLRKSARVALDTPTSEYSGDGASLALDKDIDIIELTPQPLKPGKTRLRKSTRLGEDYSVNADSVDAQSEVASVETFKVPAVDAFTESGEDIISTIDTVQESAKFARSGLRKSTRITQDLSVQKGSIESNENDSKLIDIHTTPGKSKPGGVDKTDDSSLKAYIQPSPSIKDFIEYENLHLKSTISLEDSSQITRRSTLRRRTKNEETENRLVSDTVEDSTAIKTQPVEKLAEAKYSSIQSAFPASESVNETESQEDLKEEDSTGNISTKISPLELNRIQNIVGALIEEVANEPIGTFSTEQAVSECDLKVASIPLPKRRRGKSRWTTDDKISVSDSAENAQSSLNSVAKTGSVEGVKSETLLSIDSKKKKNKPRDFKEETVVKVCDDIPVEISGIHDEIKVAGKVSLSEEITGDVSKEGEHFISTSESLAQISGSGKSRRSSTGKKNNLEIFKSVSTSLDDKPSGNIVEKRRTRQDSKKGENEFNIVRETNIDSSSKNISGNIELPDRVIDLAESPIILNSAESEVSEYVLSESVSKSNRHRRSKKHKSDSRVKSISENLENTLLPEKSKLIEKAERNLPDAETESDRTLSDTGLEEDVQNIFSNVRPIDLKAASSRKPDVNTPTGIVRDIIYGRKPKEVSLGKSKVSKSRWDVVSRVGDTEVSASSSKIDLDLQIPEVTKSSEVSDDENLKKLLPEDTIFLSSYSDERNQVLDEQTKIVQKSDLIEDIQQANNDTEKTAMPLKASDTTLGETDFLGATKDNQNDESQTSEIYSFTSQVSDYSETNDSIEIKKCVQSCIDNVVDNQIATDGAQAVLGEEMKPVYLAGDELPESLMKDADQNISSSGILELSTEGNKSNFEQSALGAIESSESIADRIKLSRSRRNSKSLISENRNYLFHEANNTDKLNVEEKREPTHIHVDQTVIKHSEPVIDAQELNLTILEDTAKRNCSPEKEVTEEEIPNVENVLAKSLETKASKKIFKRSKKGRSRKSKSGEESEMKNDSVQIVKSRNDTEINIPGDFTETPPQTDHIAGVNIEETKQILHKSSVDDISHYKIGTKKSKKNTRQKSWSDKSIGNTSTIGDFECQIEEIVEGMKEHDSVVQQTDSRSSCTEKFENVENLKPEQMVSQLVEDGKNLILDSSEDTIKGQLEKMEEKHLDISLDDNTKLEQLTKEESEELTLQCKREETLNYPKQETSNLPVKLTQSAEEEVTCKSGQLVVEFSKIESKLAGDKVVENAEKEEDKVTRCKADICDNKFPQSPGISDEKSNYEISESTEILSATFRNESSYDKDKLVPPKKNKWPRRGSYSTKDIDNDQVNTVKEDSCHIIRQAVFNEENVVEEQVSEPQNTAIEKTDNDSREASTPENSTSSFIDSEIILPLKKSKRVNEASSQFFRDSFSDDQISFEKKCDDGLSFPSYDDCFMSTSLRNNIEGLIKEIDSIDNVMSDNLDLSSNDSGKQLDGSEVKNDEAATTHALDSSISNDSSRSIKETPELSKCVPPKKKKIELPKDESSSALPNNLPPKDFQKLDDKNVENVPQAPKKKIQKLFENSQAFEKAEKSTDLPLMSPLAKKKSFLFHQEEFDQSPKTDQFAQIETTKEVRNLDKDFVEEVEVNVEDFLNLSTIGKKRKSTSLEVCLSKKEKLEDENITQEVINQTALEPSSKSSQLPQTEESTSTGEISQLEKAENETSAKEADLNLQANLDSSPSLQSTELSVIISKSPDQLDQEVSSKAKEQLESEVTVNTVLKNDGILTPMKPVLPGTIPNEPELVPISVTPTVMSEKDLADAQVEITTDKVISEKKSSTLGTFAVGFSEPSSKKGVFKQDKAVIQEAPKITETLGTEFTSKAMLKEFDNRSFISQPNAYVLKSELLDILEGNSNSSTNSSGSEQKFKTSFDNYDKKSVVQGIIDFEEAIPSQIVLSNKVSPESVLMDSPKLLERLSMSTDASKPKAHKVIIQSDIKVPESLSKPLISKLARPAGLPKPGQKILIKTSRASTPLGSKVSGSKPIILSEQIIRPATTSGLKQAVQSQGLKRQYEDVEDVETAFIIPKIAKKATEEEVVAPAPEKLVKVRKASGKAKILQQTIITPKGEVIPQSSSTTASQPVQLQSLQVQSAQDDAVFDINSMPIVLSDDLLTPESIQNMPVVLSEDVLPQSTASATKIQEKILATLPKKIVSNLGTKQIIFKTTPATSVSGKPAGKARILSTSAVASHSKISKPGATALLATGTTADGKPAKYVLVPPSVSPANTQIKAVKQTIVKKQPVVQSKVVSSGVAASVSDPATQIVGNKIMIVTNAQGQQTRVVLTPQQHKAFMQAQTGSKTKTIIKGALPKAFLETATAAAAAGPSGVVATKTVSPVPQGTSIAVSSHTGLLMPAIKSAKAPVPPKKNIQRSPSKPQKTILIKNQMGQTVRKIQGTDDADLDRQVAEQLEAIKASARFQQANKPPEILNNTNRPIPTRSTVRRPYSKKFDTTKIKGPVSTPVGEIQKQQEALPALTPLPPQSRITQVQSQVSPNIPKQATAKKMDVSVSSPSTKSPDFSLQRQQTTVPVKSDVKQPAAPPKDIEIKRPESPLRQVVIQDGLGNLTTVTVGQILAIPSETVDGQPQSYMLVTVDESGNLTPLNNDALMSLDPSLGIGGDINNMVLQVDNSQGSIASVKSTETNEPAVTSIEKKKAGEKLVPETPKPAQQIKEPQTVPLEQPKPQEVPLAVEQQIVLADGVLPGDAGGQQLIVTGDPIATQKFLESLSDGSTDLANILANADGGSVLIQADGQQILIRTNPTAQPMITDSTEGGGNPMFAIHKPNQDILAAALANTDVFQPTDQSGSQSLPVKGLQTSQLSPVGGASLYPMHVGNVLETSLTLSSPIMTPLEVPSTNSKKIDDEVDILNQVPKNVDLPITITDPNISQTVAQQTASLMELTLPMSDTGPSADIHSPSYSYSLPSLDDSVGISQKSFSSSMPLLTEDGEVESSTSSNSDRIRVRRGLESAPSSFSPNFGSLPMLSEAIESSREEVVKTSTFGDIGSLPLLSDDVIEDSGSSIGSTKPPRSSPKPIERDIVDEGLSTLGGEMCSSLSEPPPDMFDLTSIANKEEEISSDISSIPEPETLSINSENSSEIPIQPPIVANLNDLKRPAEESESSDEKRSRFD